MIIHINRSKLFTVEPAKRFAKEFGVDEKVWRECWVKYKVLDLKVSELWQYIYLRTGRKPSQKSIKRWIIRTEIYSRALEAKKLGVESVTSAFFGELEEEVIEELVRNMKFSVSNSSRSIV